MAYCIRALLNLCFSLRGLLIVLLVTVVSLLYTPLKESFSGLAEISNSVAIVIAAPIAVFLLAIYVTYLVYRSRNRRRYNLAVEECLAQIESLASQISLHVRANFLVQPCTRCHENLMSLVQVSPNAKSVKCKCDNCDKSYWAAAANRDALALKDLAFDLEELKERYIHLAEIGPPGRAEGTVHCHEHRRPGGVLVKRVQAQRAGAAGSTLHVEIAFTTPEVLLPFGQTPRELIPLSIQAKVLRRDGGKCVVCESKHNLQFDHIIPVSKGGSTSAKNIQLLCQTCHLEKQSNARQDVN